MLAGLPDTNLPGTTQQLHDAAGLHRRLEQGRRKVDVQVTPTLSHVRPLRLPQPATRSTSPTSRCLPAAPATAASTREQAVRARLDLGAARDRCSRRGSATRGRRRARTRRRSAPTARSSSSGSPACPTDPRIAGGLPTQLITGYSDLGRQATNPQWQYPTVYNPKVNYTWTRGRHSFKTGYEFQHIDTEVQDVNPLYGRDTYNGQFTQAGRRRRPATSTTSPTSCSACARSTRSAACSSRTCAATCTSPTCRTTGAPTSQLTLNLGLRYEYATPYWEARQRPVELRSGDATRWSWRRTARSTIARWSIPDRNNFGPRLGFAYTVTPAAPSSAAATASATCTSAAPAAATCCRSTGRRSSTPSSTRPSPTAPTFVPAEQGYPAGLADPSQFNPLTANITYMPRDFHSSPVQSWYISVQRELGRNMLLDVAYVGNRADDLVLFANYNQALPNNAAGTIAAAGSRRPIPELRGHHLCVQRRQVALQGAAGEVRVAHEPRRDASQLADAVGDEGQRRAVARELQRQLPGAAGLPEPGRRITALALPPAVQQHDELRVGAAVRAGTALGHRASPVARRAASAAGSSPASTRCSPASRSRSPTRRARRSSSPASRRTSAAPTTTAPNVTCDPYAQGRHADDHQLVQQGRASCVPTDPSQPFGNAQRNTVRGPMFWQFDLARVASAFALGGPARFEFRIEAFNLLNRTNFRAPNGNRSAGAFGTITSTYDPRQLQLGARLIF